MSVKNTRRKYHWHHKDTHEQTMYHVYAAYKRCHNGEVEFTRDEFVNYKYVPVNVPKNPKDIPNILKKVEYQKRIQTAIIEGYDQYNKELDNYINNYGTVRKLRSRIA